MPSARYNRNPIDISGIRYEPETGFFYRDGPFKKGKITLKKTCSGYLRAKINRRNLLLHVLAVYIMNGSFPKKGEEIDHINGDKTDNRISNLRVTDRSGNMANTKKHRDGLLPGVSLKRGRWFSCVKNENRFFRFGPFSTKEEAHIKYVWTQEKIRDGKQGHLAKVSNKIIGASFNKRSNMWQTSIKRRGFKIHLGYYLSLKEAQEAYQSAKYLIDTPSDSR